MCPQTATRSPMPKRAIVLSDVVARYCLLGVPALKGRGSHMMSGYQPRADDGEKRESRGTTSR